MLSAYQRQTASTNNKQQSVPAVSRPVVSPTQMQGPFPPAGSSYNAPASNGDSYARPARPLHPAIDNATAMGFRSPPPGGNNYGRVAPTPQPKRPSTTAPGGVDPSLFALFRAVDQNGMFSIYLWDQYILSLCG